MIQLQNIYKIFNEGKSNEKKALNNISLNINDGELVAIVGKSGAGKSTLMNIIGCLDTPTKGKYLLNNQDITTFNSNKLAETRNKYFGIITQSPFLIDNITPIENVVIPLMFNKIKNKDKHLLAMETLNNVGLKDVMHQKTAVLSGGEQQRVSIARAIINNPAVILADEPTGNLDNKNTQIIMKILNGINKEGKTVIIITHDLEVASFCERIITISDGEIINDVFNNNR